MVQQRLAQNYKSTITSSKRRKLSFWRIKWVNTKYSGKYRCMVSSISAGSWKIFSPPAGLESVPGTPHCLIQLHSPSSEPSPGQSYKQGNNAEMFKEVCPFPALPSLKGNKCYLSTVYPFPPFSTVFQKISPPFLQTWDHSKEGTMHVFFFLIPRWNILGLVYLTLGCLGYPRHLGCSLFFSLLDFQLTRHWVSNLELQETDF